MDRVRSLATQLQSEPPREGQRELVRQNIMLEQLSSVARRVVLLRTAMTCFYIATGLFVTTSIAVGVITITGLRHGWIAFVLALIGAGVLLVGSILLISGSTNCGDSNVARNESDSRRNCATKKIIILVLRLL